MITRALFNVSAAWCALALTFTGAAQAQDPLAGTEELVRKHIEKILDEAPEFSEKYGTSVAERAIQDGTGGEIEGIEAPIEHPWAGNGNPTSPLVYRFDSYFNLAAEPQNVINWSQAWSCFEPKLLAKARNGVEFVFVAGPENGDLIAECRSKCINKIQHIPHPRGSIIGAAMYDAFGCGADPDPWGYTENGYEVAEFWYPEYQVEINNYGINRIQPQQLSPTGIIYTRDALVAQKQGAEQQIIRELGNPQSYPLDTSNLQLPEYRRGRMIGQGHWGGYASPDFQDKAYGHVIRTYLATSDEEKKIPTRAGWKVDPDKSVYGALPKRKAEHDPVNVWTEHGMFDVITSVPHLSSRIRPEIMQALYGEQKSYSEKARAEKGFYESQGAAAYRVAKWPDIFGPLKRLNIQGSANQTLKEVVYKGGYELFPLVTNQSGFGSPTLSTGAVFARRVLYLAGARSPAQLGGDASGMIAGAFPQGADLGRIITYTINSQDKSREIDKLQLIAPKRPHDGTPEGGMPPIVAECMRSQNISNLTNKDPRLQAWTDRNMPRKLAGYRSDVDFINAQGGALVYTYWNRRIGCFCDRCGLPTGSSTIANGGDGDKLYDKPRKEYCRYPVVPQMTPWSAYHREETFPQCRRNGKNESFYDGTGMRDNV